MYTKILVPLDGSRFAEQALPHAMNIAAAGAVEIHLLSVAPLMDDQASSVVDMYPVYVYRDYMVDPTSESERIKLGLQDYLDHVTRRIKAAGHEVVTVIRLGQPAEEIISYASESGCEVIVMSTHGRSGIGRWVYGSVADKVLRGSATPVLLVRVQEQAE
ncbi:MAG: universal stress protein [Anaerolineales bacterium]|nr:universal stress protein [Anaerolineales bacterium]MCO5243295.1 universal stress protein [Anaerolineae bacterium]